MIGMWILWLIAIGLIAVAAWAFFRSESLTSESTTESAEEILKRRYASGEIDRDDFEKRLQDLKR